MLFYTTTIREEKTLKQIIMDFQQEVLAVIDKRNIDIHTFLQAAGQKGIDTDRIQYFGFLHDKVNEQSVLPDKARIKLIVREDAGKYQLQLQVNGIKEGLLIGRQFIRQYLHLLSNIRTLLDRRVAEIDALPPVKTPGIIAAGKDTVLDFFRAQAAKQPDLVALKSRGGSCTYAKVEEDSNRLAAYLAGEGQVKKGQAVGLLVPRSEWIITGILGILKAGAVFVPVDPAWPANRIQYILEDAGVGMLLTTTEYLPLLTAFTGRLFAFDIQQDMLPPAPAPEVTVTGEDAAYIMYTSGTTGQPKGVVIDHKGVANYAAWLHREFNLGAGHAAVLVTSYAFDLGYTAIWGTIPWGGTLHIPGEDYSRMPEKLYAYLAEERISFIKVTPSLFHLLLNAGSTAKGASLFLEKVFLGGEMIRPADIAAFMEQYPDTVFINHYGPTESTVGCIFHTITHKELPVFSARPVIGKPVLNTQVLILDEHRHILPDGIWGEICISGPGVAREYLNKPDITAQQFISKQEAVTGKLYRTGDYGRYLEDGAIELKGRKDNQAKIRGYRVEPEEIAKCLEQFPGIREAVVLLQRAGVDQHAKLVAFYTLRDDEGGAATGEAISTYLKAHLPDYMIPSDLIPVDAMPVNGNGKLNREQLLAAVAGGGTKHRRRQVMPENETERIILEAWQTVLQREDISTTDSFFELGGNSLLLVQVNIALNEFFPALTITDLFTYIDIASLAAYINGAGATAGVSLAGTALKLPAAYFNAAGPVDRQADLFVQLDEGVGHRVKAVAAACGVAETDIYLAAFAYALANSAGAGAVPLHLEEGQGVLKRLSVPVQQAESKEQLYRYAAAQREAPQLVFEAGGLIRPADEEMAEDMVCALICLSDRLATAARLFDMTLSVQEQNGNPAFSLAYAPRLCEEKMQALLEMFVSILENV
ncbi:hypothetical protein GCM10009415_42220 [Chitinophaga japonensis]